MAQRHKYKTRLSFERDMSSPGGNKAHVQTPRYSQQVTKVNQNDQVLEALSMTETIASQLEMICKVESVENRLQKLEGIFERFSDLERLLNSPQTERNTLKEKSRMIEEKMKEMDKAMEFDSITQKSRASKRKTWRMKTK